MNRDRIKDVLDRVLSWPRERQEDAVELLMLIEQHDRSPYRLTDEQAAEIRCRQANDAGAKLTLTELDERLRRLGV
jgi:hypothetical protein